MHTDRWARLAPLTGLGTVVLWVLGAIVLETVGDTPGDDATAQDFAAYFERDDNSIYIGAFLLFVGAGLLVWFAGSLRAAIATVEGGVARTASIVFGAAVATAVLSMAVFAPQVSAAFAANETDAPLTPEAAQALWFAGDGFFVATEFAAALLLAATAVSVLRTRVLPRWLAWVSFLVALVLLIPPIGWAGLIFAFPLWLIVVSLLLVRRETRTVSEPRGVVA